MSYSPLSEIRVDDQPSTERINQPQPHPQPREQEMVQSTPAGGSNSLQNSWLNSIMEVKQAPEDTQAVGPKIPEVPDKLKTIKNRECFKPLAVSIGPYHHGRNELSEVENLKVSMARQFVMESKKDIELLYDEVEKVTPNARGMYSPSSIERLTDEQFTQMMFLDGCFILQFIHCVMSKYEDLEIMSEQQVVHVKRDLLLLENQLPFSVLQSLMSLRLVRKREPFWQPEQQPVHLLELVYFIRLGKGSKQSTKRKSSKKGKRRGHYLYYSAKDLRKVGIHFGPSHTSALTDVKCKSSLFWATLKLPPIAIDVSTESLLFNLVAYETCAAGSDQRWVTSYISFMDSLIDDAEDVKVLRSKGVLNNFLGHDSRVANLFSDMVSSLLDLDTSAYNDVKRDITEQSQSKLKKWLAEREETYFSAPWSLPSFFAAAVGLALTATQTYYAIQPADKSK